MSEETAPPITERQVAEGLLVMYDEILTCCELVSKSIESIGQVINIIREDALRLHGGVKQWQEEHQDG